MKRVLGMMVLFPAVALAGNPYKDRLTDAAEGLEDAQSSARRSGPRCDQALSNNLEQAIDDVDGLRRGASERRFDAILRFVNDLAMAAPRNGCSQKVSDRIARATVHLNAARAWLEDHGDRRERRQRRDDDDDDRDHDPRRNDRDPPPVAVGLNPLRVTYNQLIGNEQAVRVDVTGLTAPRLPPKFLLGARVRPFNGPPGPWTMAPGPFRGDAVFPGRDVFTFWFKVRDLPGAAAAQGRFVVQVAVFDERNVELGSREDRMEFQVAAPPPPPPPLARDCGLPGDAGCMMARHGQYPMDATVFNGFLASLRATNSELSRYDMCRSVLANNWITAKQLGVVFDLFNSELTKFDVAKLAAPRTVNPQHALGLSAKFRSSLMQADFTKLMAEQR